MKKLNLLFLFLSLSLLGWGQDLSFDSLVTHTNYSGARVEYVTANTTMNCGSLIQLNVGQQYKLFRFAIGINNAGSQKAFIGLPDVTPGVNYNDNVVGCWYNQGVNAPVTIDNFVTQRIEDPCGNIVAYNENKAWYIVGSSPITDEPRYCSYPPNQSFPTLDTVELYPGWCSTEGLASPGTWIDITNLPAGDYNFILYGNFAPYEAATTCYPNSVTFPFYFDGGTGISFNSTSAPCNQSVPGSPYFVSATVADGSAFARGSGQIQVTWTAADNLATSFKIMPYAYLTSNTETEVTSMEKTSTSTTVFFTASDLTGSQELVGVKGGDRNNLKFRFKVKAVNAVGESAQVSSGNPAVNVK